MTNFEYFIELLQDDEDLVNEINNMDTAYIPELFNYVSEAVNTYYEFEEETEQELRSLLKEMTEDKDVEQELINAVVVCVDLLGIDVKKAYPNLYKRCFSDNKGEME